jgi:membrane fusion protein (multidrug efflux system)
MSTPEATMTRSRTLPRSARKPLTLALIAVLVATLGWWLYERWTHVFTEDARIATHLIEVSTRAAGQITQFGITQGDRLEAGQLIAQIDDRAARFGLQELEASLASLSSARERIEAEIEMADRATGGKLGAARSRLDAAIAARASAESDLQFKKSEWERAQSLRERQIISQQQWENARNAWQQSDQDAQRAAAEAESARSMVAEAQASQVQLQVLASEQRGLEHDREKLLASIEKQKVMIGDLRMVSPASGIVDETFVHPGEYLVPGQRVLLMHDPADIWIDANIKETEIRHVEPGDRVKIHVDAYPDREFEGTVQRVGNAATSQFSLLPSTNPGGNFTKVTQRLPVRITIEQSGELLRPGMMVEVAIEIR